MFSWLFAAHRRDPRSGRASDTSDADHRAEGGGRYLGMFEYTDPYALTNKQIVVRLSNTGVELFDQLTQGVIQLSGPETSALADALVDHRSWLESGRRGPQPKAEIPVGAIVGQDAGVIHVYIFNGTHLGIQFVAMDMAPFVSVVAVKLAAVLDYARYELAGGAARCIAADPPLGEDELVKAGYAYADFYTYSQNEKGPFQIDAGPGVSAIDLAVSIGEFALRHYPASLEAGSFLANSLLNSWEIGDERLERFQKAAELSKDLVRRNPESTSARYLLASAQEANAIHHRFSATPELALPHFNDALLCYAELAELEPGADQPLTAQQKVLSQVAEIVSDRETKISCMLNILAIEERRNRRGCSTQSLVERARRDLAYLTSL